MSSVESALAVPLSRRARASHGTRCANERVIRKGLALSQPSIYDGNDARRRSGRLRRAAKTTLAPEPESD
jgi:hypothetical protein